MILHIDMDAFYASVEQRDHPEWKGKCVIVGGQSHRGVVSTASYEARKLGVHSAMPIVTAQRLCPKGIFVKPRMMHYKYVSHQVMAAIQNFSPIVEPVSIDEAYLDSRGCERLFGNPKQMGRAIKQAIRDAVGLTCSIGGAPYKFLAKIASDLDKPDGLTIIPLEEAPAFIAALPIQKVPGVGTHTLGKLKALNIQTLGQIREYPEAVLVQYLGKFGKRLKDLSMGNDKGAVSVVSSRHSISTETTLESDTNDREFLRSLLQTQSEEVGRRLRRQGMRAKTIFIKIKHADFQQITRSKTITPPTLSTTSIFKNAIALLQGYPDRRKIRLIGVGVAGLLPGRTPVQMSLFDEALTTDKHWEKVDQALDAIQEKFGKTVIKRGTGLRKKPRS